MSRSEYPEAVLRLLVAARPVDFRRHGDQWTCRCPAHRDLAASLRVRATADGKLLLHCHAGCETPDILRAWNVEWSVLFGDEPTPAASNGHPPVAAKPVKSRPPPLGEPEAVYDYTDENGNLLFQVCRFAGKDFRQRRPVIGGSWAWNLHHTRRVLYRLPALTAAAPDATVYVCEGEKDADRLAGTGLVATTAPGGAGKWREEYGEPLRGRRVVLVPDNDEPGRKHAETVAKALQGVAAEVSVAQLGDLPEHGDISDWLDQGREIGDLTTSNTDSMYPGYPVYPASPASPMSPAAVRQELLAGISTATDLLGRDFDPARWSVYNLVGEGCTLLVGSPKIGKSWMVLELALAVASGGVMLGRSTSRSEVLYLALEDSDRRLRSRLETLLGNRTPPPGLHYTTRWCPITKGGLELLDTWLDEHPEVRLLVVDTLAAIKGEGPRNGDAYAHDYGSAHALGQLARRHSCSLVVVHHDRKATSEDWLHTVSGTLGLTGAADAILLLRRGRNQADAVLHTTGRDVPEEKMALRFASMRWELLDGDADVYEMDSRRRDVVEMLKAAPKPMTARMIAEGVEGNREAIKRLLRRMAKDGLVCLTDAGWSMRPTAGDPGTSGTNISPAENPPKTPVSGETPGFSENPGFFDETGLGRCSYPAYPGTHPPNACPKCGCESEKSGVSPTAFTPMRRCRACGCEFIDRDQESAS